MTNARTRARRRFGNVSRVKRSGNWLAKYPDPTGRLNSAGRVRFVSRTLPTKRAAEQFLREMQREIIAAGRQEQATEEPVPSPVPTVATAIHDFIQEREITGAAKTTVSGMRSRENAILRHDLAEIPVDRVTVDDLLSYFEWRRYAKFRALPKKAGLEVEQVEDADCARGTLKIERALLSAAFYRLVKRGVLDKNPVRDLAHFKGRVKEVVYFTESEAARLIDACGDRLRPFVIAGLLTGARRGELTGLRWRDIDFEKGLVTIRRSKTSNASHVPLHPVLKATLERLKKERAAGERIVAGEERVFLSPTGKEWKGVAKPFMVALGRAGLGDRPGLTLHSLRHSFATHFLSKGGSVDTLRRLLGHSNLATTMRYLHLIQGDAEKGIAALDFGIRVPSDEQIRAVSA